MRAPSTPVHMPAGLQDLPRWLEAAEGFSAVVEGLLRAQAATIDGAWNSSAALAAASLGLRAGDAAGCARPST